MANNDRELFRQKMDAVHAGYTPVRVGALALYFGVLAAGVVLLSRL